MLPGLAIAFLFWKNFIGWYANN